VRFGTGTLLLAGVVVLAVVSVVVPTASTQAAPGLRGPEAQQRCVDRWNQMKMHWSRTIAVVASYPRCSITLAYTYRPYRSPLCRPPARLLPGTPKLCLDRGSSFECVINRYGAYQCPTHASAALLRGWNAAVTQGRRLVLDRPPQTSPKTPLPPWARRYPYMDGFILPWTRTGQLRAGLTLRGHYKGKCAPISETTTANGALRCVDPRSNIRLDPCFPSKASWEHGGLVAACAEAPGSTTFQRLTISGSLP
jgi:hypothetical protein